MTVIRFPDLGSHGRVEFFRDLTTISTEAGLRVVTASVSHGRQEPPVAVVIAICDGDMANHEEIARFPLRIGVEADKAAESNAARIAEIVAKGIDAAAFVRPAPKAS